MMWAPRAWAYVALLPVVCQSLIVIVAEHTHFLLVKRVGKWPQKEQKVTALT